MFKGVVERASALQGRTGSLDPVYLERSEDRSLPVFEIPVHKCRHEFIRAYSC